MINGGEMTSLTSVEKGFWERILWGEKGGILGGKLGFL